MILRLRVGFKDVGFRFQLQESEVVKIWLHFLIYFLSCLEETRIRSGDCRKEGIQNLIRQKKTND